MNYKKILLLRPNYRESHYEYTGLPAGIGYISEALDKAGIPQEVVDMSLGYNYTYLKRRIEKFNPDMLGVSLMSFRYKDHYVLINKIKDDFKNLKIIAGGPHISTFREKSLIECNAIDYGVTLEGEDAMLELCMRQDNPFNIKGLFFKNRDGIVYTGDRQFKQNPDVFGFPKYKFFEKDKYPKFISLLTSRGCPYNCIFCPVQLTIGKKLRVRTPESVLDEISYWYEQGIRVFNVVDDNFTFYKQRVIDICDGIKKRKFKNITLSCRNGIRADTVDRETLRFMKEVGFNYLAFGVESGSEKILKVLKKGENLSKIKTAIKDACELGFMVTLFFIIGMPYETEEDVSESLKIAMEFPVFDVRFYNPIPFPGTELYDWIAKNNYFNKSNRDYLNNLSHWVNKPIFETPELPFEARKVLYERLNKIIKKHTFKTKILFLKDTERLFTNLGIPLFLSKYLARIYYTQFFQMSFIQSGLAAKFKKFIKK
ncbi:MAG: radical SAM protein [Patescibacteria group bacterium]